MYECQVSCLKTDLQLATKIAETLGWKISEIYGDSVLGEKPYFYLTLYEKDYDIIPRRLLFTANYLKAAGISVLRTKIQLIVLDSICGVNPDPSQRYLLSAYGDTEKRFRLNQFLKGSEEPAPRNRFFSSEEELKANTISVNYAVLPGNTVMACILYVNTGELTPYPFIGHYFASAPIEPSYSSQYMDLAKKAAVETALNYCR
jgi:hypothetical protein